MITNDKSQLFQIRHLAAGILFILKPHYGIKIKAYYAYNYLMYLSSCKINDNNY